MSEQPKVLVIKFGKLHYVEEQSYYDRDALVINGRRDWPKASDAPFRVVDGPVQSLARYVSPSTIITKYALRDDLVACSDRLRKVVTRDEWAAMPERDQALYVASAEQRENPPTPLPFEVVDGLAAPRDLPRGITCATAREVTLRRWFVWTLPCVASSEYVFDRLKERVATLDPAQFAVTVYTNIRVIHVGVASLTVGGVEYRPVKYLLQIDRDKGGCPAIKGNSLDECLANVQAYVEGQMAPIRAALQIRDCPACGRSLTRAKKRVSLRSDTPRPNVRHNID